MKVWARVKKKDEQMEKIERKITEKWKQTFFLVALWYFNFFPQYFFIFLYFLLRKCIRYNKWWMNLSHHITLCVRVYKRPDIKWNRTKTKNQKKKTEKRKVLTLLLSSFILDGRLVSRYELVIRFHVFMFAATQNKIIENQISIYECAKSITISQWYDLWRKLDRFRYFPCVPFRLCHCLCLMRIYRLCARQIKVKSNFRIVIFAISVDVRWCGAMVMLVGRYWSTSVSHFNRNPHTVGISSIFQNQFWISPFRIYLGKKKNPDFPLTFIDPVWQVNKVQL